MIYATMALGMAPFHYRTSAKLDEKEMYGRP